MINYRLNGVLFLQPIGNPTLIDPERILREAYVGLHFNTFDIYLGQKFVNWGKIDILSPVNNINHTDNTVLSLDNYFEASLPDLLCQARFYLSDSINIEIVYVPFFHPNIDPIKEVVMDQVFTISLPIIKTQHFDINADFMDKEIGLFDKPAHSIHIGVNYFSDLVDLSAYYSYYMDQSLDFDISNIKEEIIEDVAVDNHFITGTAFPGYNRAHSFGLGASFYFMDFLISSDAAFKLTRDREGTQMEIKNSQFFYGIQIERTFLRQVRGQLNFFHRYILNSDTEITSDYSPPVEIYIKTVIDEHYFYCIL